MATNTSIANAAAIAMLDLLVDRLDAGSGAGYIQIFDGTMPGSPDDADAGTVLAVCVLSDPAFGAAGSIATGARATASAVSDEASAPASGSADYFRAYDSNDVCVTQGTVGTASADMIINTIAITAGDVVSVISWTIDMPDGSD